MPEIALPAFHVTTRSNLTVEINHELAQDLDRYRAFYKQAYGAEVSDADLLRLNWFVQGVDGSLPK